MTFLLDNYDSFTYNLAQYLGELGETVVVHRNDSVTIARMKRMKFDRIVLSPGPGLPSKAGIMGDVIREFAGQVPILGVCLGHQAIGEVFGGCVVHAPTPMHGKTSLIVHDGKGVFTGLPGRFEATRYHSLVLSPDGFPARKLKVTARTPDGVIMGVRHRRYAIEGVQFHPESILSQHGRDLLSNFLTSRSG